MDNTYNFKLPIYYVESKNKLDDSIVDDLELEKRLIQSRKKLMEANPDYIIDTLDELLPLINNINNNIV